MNKLLMILFLVCSNKLNAQVLKISGTWVNAEIYNAVQHDTSSTNLNQIIPRCVYVDLSNKVTIEYRFEQKSKALPARGVSKRGDSVFFSALENNFAIVNDSIMLLFNQRHNITFKKISNHAVIGDGVQELLKIHFWSSVKKWKIVFLRNGRPADTIFGTIGNNEIHGDRDDIIFRHYEFTDDDRHYVNKKSSFGIVTFNVDTNNMADSVQVFAIKKSGPVIYLYKSDELSYKFIPIE